ncbi:MAG: SMP-30/gluconolactonase/LRE family protein [Pigmentiphaga sp.]|uniref:SMP-30/gluconolactonase/LRE family protein n=1 Tax=Pigmentiphaga sp. TaxID=1977564 RepID=UPI0029A266B7|nr:SMP-30/gluconolactonase/LRE family protein [Pigmentiphaga sp.]MDX3905331.1 SMP-30/gluconolactonase/LRE family protein [Pigmentiphaga sp.]
MYGAPPEISTRIFARLPAALHLAGESSPWIAARGAGPLHSFLEGPAFGQDGSLFCTDLAHGRIFRVDPAGRFVPACRYEGEPNGLKVHRDGRLFIADRRHGIMVAPASGGAPEALLEPSERRMLQGINDLLFAANGDLYFTDQGDSALNRPTGRLCRLRRGGASVETLVDGLAGPNGLAFAPGERLLYVAITRDNAIYSVPLDAEGRAGKVGRFIQLSGSPTGPDGLAVDQAGNLAVVHAGLGTVWLFSPYGEPLFRIRSCAGRRTTNVAYGGPGRSVLFITEAEQGAVLAATLPVPGLPLYGDADG